MRSHFIHDQSRRQFLSSAGAATAGLAFGTFARGAAADAAHPKYKFIDIHTHLGRFHIRRELAADQLVKLMDENHIERACVLPLVSPESSPYPQTSDAAIAACQRFPDRLIPFCCIDPRASTVPPTRPGHVAGVKGFVEMLQRYVDAGARGVGEHKVGLPFDHPQMMQFYEACDSLSLPILFHLDDLRCPDTPGLPRLENVLKAFPKLILIGHAAGFWASISGDATMADFGRYPEIPKPIAPGGALDRLMATYPNLYGDLSEPGGHKAIARDTGFSRQFLIRRADQLLFGTDYLMADQTVPQFELLASLNLPDEVQYKIHRGNAIRILRLGGK